MVRFFVTVLVASIAGAALGALQFVLMHTSYEERLGNVVASVGAVKLKQGDAPTPQLAKGLEPRVEVVGGTMHDFGEMQQGTKKKHTFVFRNTGQAPLELKNAGSTCKCTIGTLSDSTLEPGEQTEVTLEWKAVGVLDKFGQSATIATNDPNHPQVVLTVQGNVSRAYIFEPEAVSLGDISVSDTYSKKLFLFSYAEDPLQVSSLEWSDPKTQSKVHLQSRPIPPDDDRFPHHAKARSAVEISFDVDAGLPMGALDGRIRVNANIEALEALEVAVTGTVVGDIEIVAGSKFDSDRRTLNLGQISRKDGAETKMHLSVQGEHRKDIKFEVAEVVPKDSLIVTIGEPIERSNRTLFPIICTVPKDAPATSYPGTNPLNFGRIIILSSHPSIPKIPISVRLVVE